MASWLRGIWLVLGLLLLASLLMDQVLAVDFDPRRCSLDGFPLPDGPAQAWGCWIPDVEVTTVGPDGTARFPNGALLRLGAAANGVVVNYVSQPPLSVSPPSGGTYVGGFLIGAQTHGGTPVSLAGDQVAVSIVALDGASWRLYQAVSWAVIPIESSYDRDSHRVSFASFDPGAGPFYFVKS